MLINPGAHPNWSGMALSALPIGILAIGVLLDRLEHLAVVRWWFESGNLLSHSALLLFYASKGVAYLKGASYGRSGLRSEEEKPMVTEKVA